MLLKVRAGLSELEKIREFVASAANTMAVDEKLVGDLKLVVDEAATNIINHGYQGKPGDIEIEMRASGADLIITLRDHAPVFDPTSHQVPLPKSPAEEEKPGGFGLHLIRNIADEMKHRVSIDGGNELSLIKYNAITL